MSIQCKLQQNFDIFEFLFMNASPEQVTWGEGKARQSLGQIIFHLRDMEVAWVRLCLSYLASHYIPHASDSDQSLLATDDSVNVYERAFVEFSKYRRQTMTLLQTLSEMLGNEGFIVGLVEKIDQSDQVYINQMEEIIRNMPYNPLLERTLCEISDYHKRYQPYLAQATSLLDIGTGTGLTLQHVIQKNPHLLVAGIDIRDLRLPEVNVPFQLYTGYPLPFETDQFEVSLLFYVLHHCQDPVRLLAEATRVTRQWLIIIEEFDLAGTAKTSLDLTERYIHCALGMPADLPYQLFTQTDFEMMFRQQHLVEFERQLLPSQVIRPVQKYLYVLDCGCCLQPNSGSP